MLWHRKVNTWQRQTVASLYCRTVKRVCVCVWALGAGEARVGRVPYKEAPKIELTWALEISDTLFSTSFLWARAGIFGIYTAIGWIFKNIVSVLFLSCSAPCCPALFFPVGTLLTLTSRVYQPQQDTKDLEANSLFSQVLEKISHTLWEPLSHLRSPKNATPEAARAADSCLSVGMTSGLGPVTGMVRPKLISRRVQVLCVISELHVQTHGTIKITTHSGSYSCPVSLWWQKETWKNADCRWK